MSWRMTCDYSATVRKQGGFTDFFAQRLSMEDKEIKMSNSINQPKMDSISEELKNFIVSGILIHSAQMPDSSTEERRALAVLACQPLSGKIVSGVCQSSCHNLSSCGIETLHHTADWLYSKTPGRNVQARFCFMLKQTFRKHSENILDHSGSSVAFMLLF